jgi:hypothetical protein
MPVVYLGKNKNLYFVLIFVTKKLKIRFNIRPFYVLDFFN